MNITDRMEANWRPYIVTARIQSSQVETTTWQVYVATEYVSEAVSFYGLLQDAININPSLTGDINVAEQSTSIN